MRGAIPSKLELSNTAKGFPIQPTGIARNKSTVDLLMGIKDHLIASTWEISCEPTRIQEYRVRICEDLAQTVDGSKQLPHAISEQLQEFRRIGVCPVFRGVATSVTRERFPPNIPNRSPEIAQKLRKEVDAGRMFVCTARTVGWNPEII